MKCIVLVDWFIDAIIRFQALSRKKSEHCLPLISLLKIDNWILNKVQKLHSLIYFTWKLIYCTDLPNQFLVGLPTVNKMPQASPTCKTNVWCLKSWPWIALKFVKNDTQNSFVFFKNTIINKDFNILQCKTDYTVRPIVWWNIHFEKEIEHIGKQYHCLFYGIFIS